VLFSPVSALRWHTLRHRRAVAHGCFAASFSFAHRCAIATVPWTIALPHSAHAQETPAALSVIAPAPAPFAVGYLEIAGIWSRYPLWRGGTVIKRVSDRGIEGEIEWTIGEPSGACADTTSSRLRVVGRFSAALSCPSRGRPIKGSESLTHQGVRVLDPSRGQSP